MPTRAVPVFFSLRQYLWLAVAMMLTLGAVSACSSGPQPETNRQKLAAAEIAFRKAVARVTDLREAGVIKPGTQTARTIATAIRAGSDALDKWQAAPDDPSVLQVGAAAVKRLLDLVAVFDAMILVPMEASRG